MSPFLPTNYILLCRCLDGKVDWNLESDILNLQFILGVSRVSLKKEVLKQTIASLVSLISIVL